mmetsp:Transcript_33199/g.55927  ORF Transcript_33199/g.55927 Transcript_33199/m.55927 type:complete len:87 (+) Transcript_33199:351-611(+)
MISAEEKRNLHGENGNQGRAHNCMLSLSFSTLDTIYKSDNFIEKFSPCISQQNLTENKPAEKCKSYDLKAWGYKVRVQKVKQTSTC